MFTLTPVLCTSVSLSAAPPPPAAAGAQITFTGSASGCPNARYEFWMRPAASSTWQMVQAYSNSATLSWSSSGASGTIYFSVWAKDTTSATANFDANATTAYVVNPVSCSSVTMSASPPSPSVHGTQVTFSAAATSCTNPNPLYEFWFLSGSTWQVVQAWSTTSTWTWNTTALPAGTYHFGVWVRDAASSGVNDGGGMGRYDAFTGNAYTLS